MIAEKLTQFTTLICSVCKKEYPASMLQTYSSCEACGKVPLIAEYELKQVPPTKVIDRSRSSMWRYFDIMPLRDIDNLVTLGEGWTPILSLKHTAHRIGIEDLRMKDESLNPTGSFKARGMSAAISKAKELGVEKCIVPTAGNAGVALAAYAARANMQATVVMPTITPKEFVKECELYGGEVILTEGLIDRCAAKVAELNRDGDYFDFSTMKEPYRLEGKKTMGYEIAEQSAWQLPDVILYPAGGGTGLIGIWKAFHEMKKMGWISSNFPQMIAVQSASCAPVVKAFHQLTSSNGTVQSSIAYGLNVPKPFAMQLMLDVLQESNGDAIAVDEGEILFYTKEFIKTEGIFISPEGGALLAALSKMISTGKITRDKKVLLINTGAGGKYLSCFD
jgi:threonine synthase